MISNDPDDLLSPDDDATRKQSPPTTLMATQKSKAHSRISGAEPVTDLTTPLKTVINTRTAHGLLGVAELDAALRDAIASGSCEGLIQVRVWPQPENERSGKSKSVSMSWWLSAPVQEHLHQQTDPQTQQPESNTKHLDAIVGQLREPSSCAAQPKS